jgi:hypothetical protein
MTWNSAVGIVTGPHTGKPRDRGAILGRGEKVFLSSEAPSPVLGLSHFLIQ